MNSDSRVNEMSIRIVTLHSLWLGIVFGVLHRLGCVVVCDLGFVL